MRSSGADKVPLDTAMEGSEASIEIKIKTLDSQTYTLRVDKQMPVPALKEQIASVTGVLSEQQRLLCRGKVLKDDQLLSAYRPLSLGPERILPNAVIFQPYSNKGAEELLKEIHVEDGHTLHLVVRQPVPPSSDDLPNHSANDPASGTSRGHSNHVPIVIEAFNLPDQGDGVLPEISRIVSAVLGSLGLSNMADGGTGIDARDQSSQRLERTSGGSGMPDSSEVQSEQAGMTSQSDRARNAFGLPAAISMGPLQPPVIPDSLATLSQYLSHMWNEFDALGRVGINDSRTASVSRTGYMDSNSVSNSRTVHEGLPTPASLAEVLRSTRQLLTELAEESLQQLARQLEDQGNVAGFSARMLAQTNALRIGALLNKLGSLLLELGRTTMTVRLGETPSEAVVNAGPAVFISPVGPIPLMVQAPPFQPGTSFGAIPVGTVQSGSGLVNGLGAGFLPRRIDIQIRRGSSTATANINQEEHPPNQSVGSDSENPSTQTTSRVSDTQSSAGESGIRVVPIRTMVAAVPAPMGGQLPSESSGNSMGLYYPLLGRVQNITPGHMSGERGSQASGEHPSPGALPEQFLIPESAVQHQNSEEPAARDGSLPNGNSIQQERPNTRSVNISIIAAGRTQNNQDSERQISSSILQFLRTIYPGGEIQVEEAGSQGTTTDSSRGQAETSSGATASEPNTADQGVLLSNLLHQIMPYLSQHAGLQPSTAEEATTSTPADNSSTQNSHRPNDCEPNSKRQKKG